MNQNFHDISLGGMLAAYALLLPLLLLIRRQRLGLGREVLVPVLRMSLQLVAAGFALKYLFGIRLWYVVLGVFLVMVFFAARTVVERTELRFGGLTWLLFLAILAGGGTITALMAGVVIGVDPWYDPRWFIPLAGMIIGNSMNGCALALERYYSAVREERRMVETLVALGATSAEATIRMLRGSYRAALLPTVASMSGMGIVFLPGMMTGQILGGVPPMAAIRYQLAIMLAILGAVGFSSWLILLLERRRLFDDYQLPREELFG